MKRRNTIGTVARLLGIAAPTLRYWGDAGLLRFERDGHSRYRRFSFQTLMDICDIRLYRELGIPVKRLRTVFLDDAATIRETLEAGRQELERRKTNLEHTLGRTEARLRLLERLEALQQGMPVLIRARLGAIQRLRFADAGVVKRYLEDTHYSVALFRPPAYTVVRYGIFMGPVFMDAGADDSLEKEPVEEVANTGERAGEPIRPADEHRTPYVTGLLRVNAANPAEHDGAALLAAVRQRGYVPGDMVGRYLLSSGAGVRQDHYEALVECREPEHGRR